jgi:hypothetical protein
MKRNRFTDEQIIGILKEHDDLRGSKNATTTTFIFLESWSPAVLRDLPVAWICSVIDACELIRP